MQISFFSLLKPQHILHHKIYAIRTIFELIRIQNESNNREQKKTTNDLNWNENVLLVLSIVNQ